MANKAYKFRIYPDDAQKVLFARTFGCVRMVYNHWLARKIRQYEENKTTVTYTVCAKEMAEMKKTEAYAFLREVDSVALQQSLRHLDTAFQNFFKQPKTGFPKFKSKKQNKKSYSTMYQRKHRHIEWIFEIAESRPGPVKTTQSCSERIQIKICNSKPDTRRKILCKYSF